MAAQALTGLGYHYMSLSDALRVEAEKIGISHSREDLIRLGQELRRQEGPGVLASRTCATFGPAGLYVIDSIRNPAEIDILKGAGRFFLLGIDAPIEQRYAWAMQRGRNENARSVEEFRKMEEREFSDDSRGQQLNKCLERVDALLDNTSTVDDLSRKVVDTVHGAGFPVS